MLEFINETDPICVIFCASPGCFANLSQLRFILTHCQSKGIVCALVCTNMWSNPQRKTVMEEFEKELSIFGHKKVKISTQPHPHKPHEIKFFGTGALCIMVNSIEYSDPEYSEVVKPVQGIDELIQGVMDLLDDKKVLGWCSAVLNRRSFWEKCLQNTHGFFTLRVKELKSIKFNSIAEYTHFAMRGIYERFARS